MNNLTAEAVEVTVGQIWEASQTTGAAGVKVVVEITNATTAILAPLMRQGTKHIKVPVDRMQLHVHGWKLIGRLEEGDGMP